MKALVYSSFLFKSNLGDNYFKDAYLTLFPELELTFTDKITAEIFSEHDMVFLGGGSFLDGEPRIDKAVLERLPEKPLIYLGVGGETGIHPWHKFLLKKASLVAIRSEKHLDKMLGLNENTIVIPDLVYSLIEEIKKGKKKEKHLLYLPNSYTVSKWNDAAWKMTSWEHFKGEISQVFEILIEDGWKIDVLAMCDNGRQKDGLVAAEIFNKMNVGGLNILPFEEMEFSDLSETISSYELVMSQRFHGLVVADMTSTPCINLHHHDKLKEFRGRMTKECDFYRSSKGSILAAINDLLYRSEIECLRDVGINRDTFKTLKDRIKQLISKD